MTTTTDASMTSREQDLVGQTVVVIGGSAGIGLETARLARAHGADVVLTARRADRLRDAANDVGAQRTAAFDVTDLARLEQFFAELPAPIDHVLFTGGGPYYSTLADMDFDEARRDVDQRIVVTLAVARYASARMRPPGTLLFMGGTGGRSTAPGFTLISAMTAALPALVANLALELAPIRANVIAAGFVDTPLSATLLGDQLDARRAELRDTLPIRRVVGPADVAALAVHLMVNSALTGATFDIDGGQQLLASRGATR
jgi:NAD(P)-dependent dehydrogenase (short-subunit alcohol dehydrogenase family)